MKRRRRAPCGVAATHACQDAAPSEVIIRRQIEKSPRTMYNGPQPPRFSGPGFAGSGHPSSTRVELTDYALHDGGATVESGWVWRFEQRADALKLGSRRSQLALGFRGGHGTPSCPALRISCRD